MSKHKTVKRRAEREATIVAGKDGIAGTYVFDKELGKVVKVSDRIPGVSSRGRSAEEACAEGGPCGRTECGGGACQGD